MGNKQKTVLVGVIILIVAMLVYPPFQYTGENGVVTNMGYDWIYDPPRYLGRYNAHATINVPVPLVQWLGVLLVGGLGLYLAKDPYEPGQTTVPVEPHANETQTEDFRSHAQTTDNRALPADVSPVRGPVGVGGWLFLLIAGLMVFGPFLGAGRLYGEIMMLERTYPNLSSASEWSTYLSRVGWVFLGSAAISFWGGLRLSREKDWSAVENAIAALWISGPGAIIALGVLVPLSIFGKAGLPDSDMSETRDRPRFPS